MFAGGFGSGNDPVTNHASHGAAHEAEIECGDDSLVPANPPMRHRDGIIHASFRPCILKAVSIFAAVTKFQRVIIHRVERNAVELAIIKGHGKPAFGR